MKYRLRYKSRGIWYTTDWTTNRNTVDRILGKIRGEDDVDEINVETKEIIEHIEP